MMELSEKQQQICDWLIKLQLPVYAEAFRGSVRLLREKSSGYGTFVCHTGRDIMNFLARTVAGIQSGRVQYEQLVDNLEKKWPDTLDPQASHCVQLDEQGHRISPEVYEYIDNLIEEHKEGRRRKQEAGELFLDMFLGSPEKDKDAIRKKWKDTREFFVKCAHLREEDFFDDVLVKIRDNFQILEDLLHSAAELEYSRISTLDKILEEANNSVELPKSKKQERRLTRMVERSLALIEKETDRQYFFSRLNNPAWIQPLAERGCFEGPPNNVHLQDGYLQCPSWGELEYLRNVCKEARDEVVEIVLALPSVDNPRVYADILEIALELDAERSARLLPKILESSRLEFRFFPFKFPDLLAYWVSEYQTDAALELAKVLVQFVPDPKSEEKQRKLREIKKNGTDNSEVQLGKVDSTLRPIPRFRRYRRFLNEHVRLLAENEPFIVASMLIDATAKMIRLGKHEDELEGGTISDYSEIWCPRLNEPRRDYPDSKESLVHTLNYACERVFENEVESIELLDRALRSQRWGVFTRLRQHLYALHPCEQTKPWIRELIIQECDYGRWEHQYEFQRMVRLAAEHFGEELLTEDDRKEIYDAILSGPPEEDFREWLGDKFTETQFRKRRRQFHRQQFRPFKRVLFGEYASYFQKLEAEETADEVTDESYRPFRISNGGWSKTRSPRSTQDLAYLSDEDLLEYINNWEDQYWDRDDQLTEINIDALAGAFQKVFKDSIIPDAARFNFWTKNRDNVLRPIYVKSMINAMQDVVMATEFDKLEECFSFCRWVLTHPDPQNDASANIGRFRDGSREHPRWHTSRRAVCDFIEACVNPDVDVPLLFRGQLGSLLDILCTQFDSDLDTGGRNPSDFDSPIAEAISTTRGHALENLIKFALWVRRQDDGAKVPEIGEILQRRMRSDADYPLTVPEFAVLGRYFHLIFDIDAQWAVAYKSRLFPRNNKPAWQEAFGNLLRSSRPNRSIFYELRGEYEFALEHLDGLKKEEWSGENSATDCLAQNLFTYYLWDVYPLKGVDSLLERFYSRTGGEREHWAKLFSHIGYTLRNTGGKLDEGLRERIVAYFDWRLEAGEPTELQEFVFWLEADCLDGEWRLNAYSRILDLLQNLNWDQWRKQKADLSSDAIHWMREMLPAHTPGAVECLAKLIDSMPTSGVYDIPTDDAKAILNAGRDHDDEVVRKKADEIRENMLKRGFLSVLD